MYMPADVGLVGEADGERDGDGEQPLVASGGLVSPALEMSQQRDWLN